MTNPPFTEVSGRAFTGQLPGGQSPIHGSLGIPVATWERQQSVNQASCEGVRGEGQKGGSRGALAIRMPGGGCQMGCHNSDRQAAVRPEMERGERPAGCQTPDVVLNNDGDKADLFRRCLDLRQGPHQRKALGVDACKPPRAWLQAKHDDGQKFLHFDAGEHPQLGKSRDGQPSVQVR